MQIFLAALKEMTGHFIIWSFALLLLWFAKGKVQRTDRIWVATWERNHNAPISTFVRSWTTVLRVVTFLKWAVLITDFLLLAWNWKLLQVFLANGDPNMPRWVRDGITLMIKSIMNLLFAFVFLVGTCRVMRIQLNRIRELAANDKAG